MKTISVSVWYKFLSQYWYRFETNIGLLYQYKQIYISIKKIYRFDVNVETNIGIGLIWILKPISVSVSVWLYRSISMMISKHFIKAQVLQFYCCIQLFISYCTNYYSELCYNICMFPTLKTEVCSREILFAKVVAVNNWTMEILLFYLSSNEYHLVMIMLWWMLFHCWTIFAIFLIFNL